MWAIILVAALGFGPFAGVLALGVAGVSTLGKLYAEAIEAINPRPGEASRATGSAGLAVFTVAVLPQAIPLMVSYTLLDFESNIRSATILGIVGAGGIGFEVQAEGQVNPLKTLKRTMHGWPRLELLRLRFFCAA